MEYFNSVYAKLVDQNYYKLVAVVAGAVIVVESTLFYIYYNRSTKQLETLQSDRNAERSGRIQVQQKLRNLISCQQKENGYQFNPIGHIESPYKERRGTPRQPMLVPASRGFIRLNKQKIQAEHFAELKQFSHVWVIFIFHENTNIDSGSVHARVKPPRLFGKKVGCLSTRSPHRPNPIGLSVCEIVSVTSDSIEIACLDLMDGTPVLDVKPYLPWDIVPFRGSIYGEVADIRLPMMNNDSKQSVLEQTPDDFKAQLRLPVLHAPQDLPERVPFQLPSVRELSVPEWISDTDHLKPVVFSSDALVSLRSMADSKEFRLCRDFEHAKDFVTQVLAQDVRGRHQGRGSGINMRISDLLALHDVLLAKRSGSIEDCNHSKDMAINDIMNIIVHKFPELNPKHVVFVCSLDSLYIEFITTIDCVVILSISSNDRPAGGKSFQDAM